MDKLTLGSTKCAVGMNNRNSLSGFFSTLSLFVKMSWVPSHGSS